MKMYYNPRCNTCRVVLKKLQQKGATVEIVEYLKHPPKKEELQNILKKLHKSPIDIIRTKENIYKEKIAGKNFSDEELISLMVKNPILIERPIVIEEDRAILGRPPEKVLKFFKKQE